MPLPIPDCPNGCDSATPLEVIRADTRGLRWLFCPVCSKTCLVDDDGRVLHKSTD